MHSQKISSTSFLHRFILLKSYEGLGFAELCCQIIKAIGWTSENTLSASCIETTHCASVQANGFYWPHNISFNFFTGFVLVYSQMLTETMWLNKQEDILEKEFDSTTLEAKYLLSVWVILVFSFKVLTATNDMAGTQRLFAKYRQVIQTYALYFSR